MKPAPLSVMTDEIAGLVGKGDAVANPAAAVSMAASVVPPEPARTAKPQRPRPVPVIVPPPVVARGYEATSRAAARVQVGLRLLPERHDQLKRICYDLHQNMQFVIEEALNRYMDAYDGGRRD